jgi:type II secretory pathway component GspD/PulD (secretin)
MTEVEPAVIAEITSSDINELGIQWLGGNDNGMGMINFNGQIPSLLTNKPAGLRYLFVSQPLAK